MRSFKLFSTFKLHHSLPSYTNQKTSKKKRRETRAGREGEKLKQGWPWKLYIIEEDIKIKRPLYSRAPARDFNGQITQNEEGEEEEESLWNGVTYCSSIWTKKS